MILVKGKCANSKKGVYFKWLKSLSYIEQFVGNTLLSQVNDKRVKRLLKSLANDDLTMSN